MDKKRLMVIDDDPTMCDYVGAVGDSLGFEVRAATRARARAAEQEVEDFRPDFIVLDLFMPDMDGIEVLHILAKHRCAAAILMVSNYEDEILAQALKLAEGLGLNLAGSLHKPIQLPRLEAALQAAA